MIINHNITALNTHRQMGSAQNAQASSMEKLSSGLRINSAKDDAAGLAISEKMRGQIRGLEQATTNAQDGISFIQTAEGALNETHDILQRMRELAVQSANDTNTDTDRGELQKEVDQLAEEITRIANNTEFNSKSLLNGAVNASGEKAATFHIGANSNQNLSLTINAMDAKSLGVAGDKTVFNGTTAGNIDTATIADTKGAKVVDGAVLTFTYNAAGTVNGTGSQTAATVADTNVTNEAAALTATRTGAITTADAGNYRLEFTSPTAFKLQKETSTPGTYADVAGQTGTVGTAFTGIAGTSVNVAAATGGAYASGDTMSFTVTADTANAENVTITNAGGDQQVVAITDETASSLTVTAGDFAGVSIKLDAGQTLADLTAGDTVTVGSSTTASAAATFTSGAKSADAVAAKGIDISSQTAANTAITSINDAIENVSGERSKLGAVQNRLEHTINNLGTSAENLTAAESRIRDVDYAEAA
ncbi:flagellin [Planomicrobium sp. CPCC 101079]|uniref:flagellin N-terminal helical domain-containing protein n=1 Tax=Planomicrobium sp. CPCC 101079 TaxID=2599618 RepID=UPI0011B84F35|nr:flagellin [Planomicrobium sp. CPCC 101079]TWT03668.1 hypothetical protein FQV28_11660 [Planomicrobium sp. CPCC 101079]